MANKPVLPPQLLGIPPALQVMLGLVITAAAVVGAVLFWETKMAAAAMGLPLLAGLALMIAGQSEKKRQREFAVELREVEGRWDEIARGLSEAQERGDSVIRYLQTKGVRSYEIRRWLLSRLGVAEGPTGRGA